MAKDAFWKHKQLLKRNINLQVKKRRLQCYGFLVVKYSCESWTLNKDLSRRMNALLWNNGVTEACWKSNGLTIIKKFCVELNMEDMFLYNGIKKQKLSLAGHLLRGSAGETALQILEDRINSNVAQGRPRWMWIDDVKINVGWIWIHMKVLKVLLKTDIYGEPVSIRHVNLLHQKTTADDDER